MIFFHTWTLQATLIPQEGLIALWSEDSQPHRYFLHLFGTQFLDAFIAETNLLEEKTFLKDHLGSCSRLQTYKPRRTFNIFCIKIIINRSMKAFWSTKDWSQKPTSFVLEEFLLETSFPPTDDALLHARFSRKQKK